MFRTVPPILRILTDVSHLLSKWVLSKFITADVSYEINIIISSRGKSWNFPTLCLHFFPSSLLFIQKSGQLIFFLNFILCESFLGRHGNTHSSQIEYNNRPKKGFGARMSLTRITSKNVHESMTDTLEAYRQLHHCWKNSLSQQLSSTYTPFRSNGLYKPFPLVLLTLYKSLQREWLCKPQPHDWK